jgi:hypothetical protein
MTDIVERLRDADTTRRIGESYADTHERRQRDRNEAAAEIERLRAAMEPFAKAADGFDTQRIKNPEEWFAYGGVSSNSGTVGAITVGDLRRARAVLAEEAPCTSS